MNVLRGHRSFAVPFSPVFQGVQRRGCVRGGSALSVVIPHRAEGVTGTEGLFLLL